MSFYKWQTDWDDFRDFRKKRGEPIDVTQDQFWILRQQKLAQKGGSARNESDLMWLREGSPYYNIHPKLVDQLTKINLEKIPTSLVEVPTPFDVVNIRLTDQQKSLTLDETHSPRREEWAVKAIPAGAFLRSMLMMRPTERILESVPGKFADPNKVILFAFDFGVVEPTNGIRSIGFAPLAWESENDSLQDSINAMIEHTKAQSDSYKSLVEGCCRLAITVGFLANSHDSIIEPDVITKDKPKFADADETARATMVERAHRRGKIGFNVGNDMMFVTNPDPAQSTDGGGEGKELQWSHIRGGYPQAVRYGKGKKKVKVMWFRPTRVRGDLPFKPE